MKLVKQRAAVVGSAISLAVLAAPAAAVTDPVTTALDLPTHATVLVATERAADYYRSTFSHTTLSPSNGWQWSTYAQGVQALYRQTGQGRYLADNLAWGKAARWGISTETNPDSIKAAETYYDLNALDPTASLTAADAKMSTDFANLAPAQYDWADALFMGLPVWARWAVRTANPAYLDKMDDFYTWQRDSGATGTRCAGKTVPQAGLFDDAQGLWYRDCTFVGARDVNGQPVFWARGNGWVIAALAQVLDALPPGDPHADQYAAMLSTMAGRLRTLQGSDGLWRSSLTDPALFPAPETSASALITYALAYGIRTGLLDGPTYLPVVATAWHGLTTVALQPSGFVSGCQAVGASPGPSYAATAPRTAPTTTSSGTVNVDSPPYCVGALLLAGSEIARLTASPSTGRPVTFTAQEAGNEARRVADGDVSTRWSAKSFPQSVTIDLGAVHRISNAMLAPYQDRAYRYRIQTSIDQVSWTTVVDRTSNTATGTALDDFVGGTVSARYARLTVTGVADGSTSWTSINEFSVHDSYLPRVDLARTRPTSSTSAASGHAATAATDGSSATYWSSTARPTTTAPQTLRTDLGSSVPVDTVRVFAKVGSGPRHVTVGVSGNGTSWTTVAAVDLPDAEGPATVIFPSVSARYVRLVATSSYSMATESVEELEVLRAGLPS